jgi:hypothetical protein
MGDKWLGVWIYKKGVNEQKEEKREGRGIEKGGLFDYSGETRITKSRD